MCFIGMWGTSMCNAHDTMTKKYNEQVNKLINRFISRGKRFEDYHYGDGMLYIINVIEHFRKVPDKKEIIDQIRKSSDICIDIEYYCLSKSIELVEAIRLLYRASNRSYQYDSMMMLARGLCENYVVARYCKELIDMEKGRDKKVKEFLMDYVFASYHNRNVTESDTVYKFEYKKLLCGSDHAYFQLLYGMLCNYSHVNFAAMAKDIYDETLYNRDFWYLYAKVISVFMIEKVFETIMMDGGEDFVGDDKIKCIDLMYDSLEFEKEVFGYLREYFSNNVDQMYHMYMWIYTGESTDIYTKRDRMLKYMLASLDDKTISDLDKSDYSEKENKYKRNYVF